MTPTVPFKRSKKDRAIEPIVRALEKLELQVAQGSTNGKPLNVRYLISCATHGDPTVRTLARDVFRAVANNPETKATAAAIQRELQGMPVRTQHTDHARRLGLHAITGASILTPPPAP